MADDYSDNLETPTTSKAIEYNDDDTSGDLDLSDDGSDLLSDAQETPRANGCEHGFTDDEVKSEFGDFEETYTKYQDDNQKTLCPLWPYDDRNKKDFQHQHFNPITGEELRPIGCRTNPTNTNDIYTATFESDRGVFCYKKNDDKSVLEQIEEDRQLYKQNKESGLLQSVTSKEKTTNPETEATNLKAEIDNLEQRETSGEKLSPRDLVRLHIYRGTK